VLLSPEYVPSPSSRREVDDPPIARVCRVLVALLVPVLGFWWLSSEKTVLLAVDGRSEHLATHAGTVGELLDRAGIRVGPEDRLTPGPTTTITDGMAVELVQARRVTVLVGGTPRRLFVPALRAEDVITALRRGGTRGELVSPAPLAPVYDGMVLEVGAPVPVTVVTDGQDHDITAPEGTTVGALLTRLGVEVDPDDRVTPALAEKVTEGIQVVVQRVVQTAEERQVAIAAPVEERPTADLREGERREVSAGHEGVLGVVERVTWVDGVPKERVRTGERVIIEPEPRIVEVGIGPADEATDDASDEDLQAAIPSESGNIDTGGASWYTNGDGLTAAHRSLPKGTIVTVTNLANGKSVKVRINDRGPFIPGRVIDLNKAAFSQIASPSEGVIEVRITW
jgi:uncharacterized protein YabE (DUF348 family)